MQLLPQLIVPPGGKPVAQKFIGVPEQISQTPGGSMLTLGFRTVVVALAVQPSTSVAVIVTVPLPAWPAPATRYTRQSLVIVEHVPEGSSTVHVTGSAPLIMATPSHHPAQISEGTSLEYG